MKLGNFSVSLAVKDIAASKAFYEKLGFTKYDGDESQNWLIMQNGAIIIGLFQGMFEDNILTFNPMDGRAILKNAREAGLEPMQVQNEEGEGAMSFALVDPDGNPLLFDQHDAEYMKKLQKKKQIIWTDLTVPDAESVRDFYQAVVGWKPEDVPVEDYVDFNMMANNQPIVGVCHKQGVNKSIPSQWMNYFSVEDLDASLKKVVELNGKVVKEPSGDAGSRYAIIEDPSGAVCALSE